MIAPSIAGAATSITAFVGPLPQGPQQAPVAISDIADFERSFGPVASAGVLGRSVSLFFANGGTRAYVVREATRVPGSIAGYGAPAGAADLYSLDVVETFNLLCLPATAEDPCSRRIAGEGR
jgi:hypothetical protein